MSASTRRGAQKLIRGRGKEKCPHHQGQVVIYFCEDCDELACPECVVSTHKRHALESLGDIIPNTKRQLKDFIDQVEQSDLPHLQADIQRMENNIFTNERNHEKIIEDLLEQGDVLKAEIDIIIKNMSDMCRNFGKENYKTLLGYKKEIQAILERRGSQLQECKDTLTSGTHVQLFDLLKEITMVLGISHNPKIATTEITRGVVIGSTLEALVCDISPKAGQESPEVERSHFDKRHVRSRPRTTEYRRNTRPPTKKQDSRSKTTYGNIDVSSDELTDDEAEEDTWRVESQFSPPDPDGKNYSQHATDSNEVWICCGKRKLHLLNKKGKSKRKIGLSVNVCDFSVSPNNGDIWFCSCDSGKKIFRFRTRESVMFTTDLDPLSICVTSDGNIVIGFCENVIMKYTQKGKILHETSYSSPRCFAECPKTNNIVVVYNTNLEGIDYYINASICIFDEYLNALYRFQGEHIDPYVHCPFYPVDVCYTAKGEIVVADKHNKSIIMVSGQGEYVQKVHTDPKHCAQSLCVLSDGKLLATFNNRVKVLTRERWFPNN